ncbi:MAG: preprotein translocase subunit YajC [Clostridia bacterium]|nr:preprotein translocase subunit YajC [Clostridia bacterium]
MGGTIGYFIMIAGILVVGYFFMIRPQKKQEQQVKNMRDSLQVGDEITTIGGIIGKIVSIKEETLVLETSRDGTKIRILRSAVRCVDVPAEDAQNH